MCKYYNTFVKKSENFQFLPKTIITKILYAHIGFPNGFSVMKSLPSAEVQGDDLSLSEKSGAGNNSLPVFLPKIPWETGAHRRLTVHGL